MLLSCRRAFRKLLFQMIADTHIGSVRVGLPEGMISFWAFCLAPERSKTDGLFVANKAIQP